ncbi:MAG: hypothetical protein M1819_002695 [Sarea resinae]|nr:MAG: hypothetical protein M1819_002695 [Sarea resinae]
MNPTYCTGPACALCQVSFEEGDIVIAATETGWTEDIPYPPLSHSSARLGHSVVLHRCRIFFGQNLSVDPNSEARSYHNLCLDALINKDFIASSCRANVLSYCPSLATQRERKRYYMERLADLLQGPPLGFPLPSDLQLPAELRLMIAEYFWSYYAAMYWGTIIDRTVGKFEIELDLRRDIYAQHIELESRGYLHQLSNDPKPGCQLYFKARSSSITEMVWVREDHFGIRSLRFGSRDGGGVREETRLEKDQWWRFVEREELGLISTFRVISDTSGSFNRLLDSDL